MLLSLLLANSAYLATITLLEWTFAETYQNFFYLCMFLGHLALGLLVIVPFLVFSVIHMRNTWRRRNRRAVRVGYALFGTSLVLLVSGLLLFQVEGFEINQPTVRQLAYWAHVVSPVVAIWLYTLHRLVGAKIRWKFGVVYAAGVAAAVAVIATSHRADPRKWNEAGPKEGEQYFYPSLARTATGNFIPAKTLMMDDYCQKCHADVHASWSKSAHHLSSFNNPMYLASVKETRKVSLERDGNVQASRWCAGCHDPVPFFSGAFDDPNYDLARHATAHAGITCTACHAITHVNSTRGNADFTIEEPIHYPFAQSDNAFLQWVNNQLVKSKPTFHKKTFLKPHHTTAEFCSTCHKVHLPEALNHYREFTRGQNHYDSYLLSGVSGHGSKSFYYPDKAKENCSVCHMPLAASKDFGAKDYDGTGTLSVHDHLFPAANTGLAWIKGHADAVKAHQEFQKGITRVDIFGVKEEGAVDGKLHAPLRSAVPTLEPGKKYLLETVVRTLKLGHHFSQGTIDSNEIWLDVTVSSGDRVIGRNGAIDDQGEVDRWAFFVNAFVIDEHGNRINRRNPQDIRVALYDHQIPPGAARVGHYGLQVPTDLTDHITVEVKLQYRKFDQEFMRFVTDSWKEGEPPIRGHVSGRPYGNPLPITTLAADSIVLPVQGIDKPVPEQKPPEIPVWQRWNDYGIGMLLENKAELKQAADAFAEVEKQGRFDGPLNLARVYYREGRLDEAVQALKRAGEAHDPPAPDWVLAWFSGLVNRQQGNIVEAVRNFQSIVTDDANRAEARKQRGFNFSLDYEAWNELGGAIFDVARQRRLTTDSLTRTELLQQAAESFEYALKLDAENVTAHYNLALIYDMLKSQEPPQPDYEAKAAEHRAAHERYRPDNTIMGRASRLAREKYPAANHAAEDLVIYPLHHVPPH